jgi:hypothetical protein
MRNVHQRMYGVTLVAGCLLPAVCFSDEFEQGNSSGVFPALHLVANDSHGFSTSVGMFTLAGPKADTLHPLPEGTRYVAYDLEANQYYGLVRHDFCKIDLKTKQAERMQLTADVPRLSWPCGLTFDTKRKRAILVSLGGEGHMYSYTPKSDKWALVASMNNIDLSGITYDTVTDSLYGVHRRHDGGPIKLTQYNSRGAVVKTQEIDATGFPAEFAHTHFSATPFDLVAVSGHVLMITATQIYAVDPATAEIKKMRK